MPQRPVAATAPANRSLGNARFLQLTVQDRDKLDQVLRGNMDEQIGNLGVSVGNYNQEAEQWITQMPISPQERDDLVAMMAAGDVQGVEGFFQQNPSAGNQGVQDAILGVAGLNQGFADLNTAALNSASAQEIAAALDSFADARQAASDGLLAITSDAGDRARLRDLGWHSNQKTGDIGDINGLLDSLADSTTDPWAGAYPSGNIPTLYVPGFAANSYYPIDGGLICGTGGVGSCRLEQQSIGEACGFPVCADDPVAEALGTAGVESNVLISNPENNGGAINFLLGDKSRSLAVGEQREFETTASVLIQFDRGNGTGTARYTLKPGSGYKFAVSEGGWDLRAQRIEVILDNSANSNAFNYVVDNEVVSIRAGETRTHTAGRPIEVRFDRGDGEESRKVLDSGRYQIAVNLESMNWDLHPFDDRTIASNTGETPSTVGSLTIGSPMIGSPMIGD